MASSWRVLAAQHGPGAARAGERAVRRSPGVSPTDASARRPGAYCRHLTMVSRGPTCSDAGSEAAHVTFDARGRDCAKRSGDHTDCSRPAATPPPLSRARLRRPCLRSRVAPAPTIGSSSTRSTSRAPPRSRAWSTRSSSRSPGAGDRRSASMRWSRRRCRSVRDSRRARRSKSRSRAPLPTSRTSRSTPRRPLVPPRKPSTSRRACRVASWIRWRPCSGARITHCCSTAGPRPCRRSRCRFRSHHRRPQRLPARCQCLRRHRRATAKRPPVDGCSGIARRRAGAGGDDDRHVVRRTPVLQFVAARRRYRFPWPVDGGDHASLRDDFAVSTPELDRLRSSH